MLAPRTNPHRVGRQPPPGRHTRNTPIYLALYQAQRPFDDVASEYDIRNEQERAVLRQEYESTDALYARWKHDLLVAVPTLAWSTW